MTTRRQRMRLWLSPSSFVGTPKLQPTTWITPYSTSEAVPGGERVETGHGFSWLAIDDNAIWATNAIGKTVTRIDARTLTVTNRSELRRTPAAIAKGADSVWIVCTNGWLWRFGSEGLGEGVARLKDRVRGLACERESTWVLHAGGDLVAVDQTTGEPRIETKISRGGRQLLDTDGGLLALCDNGRRVCRVTTETGAVEAEAKLPARGVRGAILDGTLWVACGRRFSPGVGTLIPVDLGSLAVGTPRSCR